MHDETIKFDELKEEFSDGDNENEHYGFKDDPAYLIENFVMCHGSNLCWDIELNRFMKIEHLNLSAPMSFSMWKGMPGRKIIDIDKVVFDPAGTKTDIINMFSGISLKPKKGNAEPILNHLFELCNGDEDSYNWILKWIAYPLQNLGSKMATSVVMHGIEGTGKNIFWDCVKAIYGRYGIQIGQSQIESEFNAWLSCKLFIIANEVVSNRERRHIKGKIKQLITESPLPINQKNMPLRDEDIFANFVFLSNESQPIDTDSSDRRFMVIEAKTPQESWYFAELKKTIDIQAFYEYLLNLDLEGFSPHSKPLVNEAKKELLRLNSNNTDRFIADWLAEETEFPRQTIPAGMLYSAYLCWCAENGEKWTVTKTAFGRSLSTIPKEKCSFIGTTKKQVIYFVDEPIRTVVNSNDFEIFNRVLVLMSNRFNLKI